MVSAVIQHAQRNTTRARHSRWRETEHVAIEPSTGYPVAIWPTECVVRLAEGGESNDLAFTVIFMDDAISVEVQCTCLSQSLASMHLQAMSERSDREEPLLSRQTVTGWATQQEILGYDVDTESMTIALPAQKVDGLRV